MLRDALERNGRDERTSEVHSGVGAPLEPPRGAGRQGGGLAEFRDPAADRLRVDWALSEGGSRCTGAGGALATAAFKPYSDCCRIGRPGRCSAQDQATLGAPQTSCVAVSPHGCSWAKVSRM